MSNRFSGDSDPRAKAIPHRADVFRSMAKKRLPRDVFSIIDGRHDDGPITSETEHGFGGITLKPRLAFEHKLVSTNTVLFGELHDMPFGIAPLGISRLVHRGADHAMARASKWGRVPVCVPSNGTGRLEDMMEWSDGRVWFQLSAQSTPDETDALLNRIVRSGCRHLIVTMTPPQAVPRYHTLDDRIARPVRAVDFIRTPVWAFNQFRSGSVVLPNLSEGQNNCSWEGFSQEGLARLREKWAGRLIVKGVSDPEDAKRLKEIGVDGLYVSTSCGIESYPGLASVDTLWDIRGAIGSTMGLVVDGMFRTGEDVVKAVALGADFVMFGRPILYALGAEGPSGLTAYLNQLAEEVEATMARIGCFSVTEIMARSLMEPPPPRVTSGGIRLVDTNDAG